LPRASPSRELKANAEESRHAEKARDGIAHRASAFGERRVRDVIGNGVNGTPKIIALCSAMALNASRLVSSSISQHAPVQGPAFVAPERP
jgi:hypothetical protein